MSNQNVLLISGVAGYWGSRIAKRMISSADFRVIGVDSKIPEETIEDLDYIQAGIGNPMLVELLNTEQVDTVCHLQFDEMTARNERSSEANISRTIDFLGICAEAGVKHIVFRSSTLVYGALPNNPAFLTEDKPLSGSRHDGFARDMIEIETFINGFRRQNPAIDVTVLRFANIIGNSVDSPMTRYLRLKPPVSLLGFDPIMQFIHEDDVVEALALAIKHKTAGVFNIAADGAMPLSRALRLVKKIPIQVFHPFAYKGFKLLTAMYPKKIEMVPIEWDYLRYSWVADLTKMREELGFEAVYLAAEALREFGRNLNGGEEQKKTGAIVDEDGRLRDIIEQRKRMKARE